MAELQINGNSTFQDKANQAILHKYQGDVKNKAITEGHLVNSNNGKQTVESTTQSISIAEIQLDKNPVKPRDGIYELCNSRREKLLPFLNNNIIQFEKLARSFAWVVNTNDKLKCCNKISMINAFYKCCEYGLDPATSLEHAYLIPYKGNIDFQIGYKGWLKLLYSSPLVANVYSYAVYEEDEFLYELGMNPNIKHIPSHNEQELDKLIATYGVVKLKNGEAQIRVCWRKEIEESRAKSAGAHKSCHPWNTSYKEMALIVPIRKMGRILGVPLRSEEFEEI